MKQTYSTRAANAIGRAQAFSAAWRYFRNLDNEVEARFFRDMMRMWGTSAAFHIKLERPYLAKGVKT